MIPELLELQITLWVFLWNPPKVSGSWPSKLVKKTSL